MVDFKVDLGAQGSIGRLSAQPRHHLAAMPSVFVPSLERRNTVTSRHCPDPYRVLEMPACRGVGVASQGEQSVHENTVDRRRKLPTRPSFMRDIDKNYGPLRLGCPIAVPGVWAGTDTEMSTMADYMPWVRPGGTKARSKGLCLGWTGPVGHAFSSMIVRSADTATAVQRRLAANTIAVQHKRNRHLPLPPQLQRRWVGVPRRGGFRTGWRLGRLPARMWLYAIRQSIENGQSCPLSTRLIRDMSG